MKEILIPNVFRPLSVIPSKNGKKVRISNRGLTRNDHYDLDLEISVTKDGQLKIIRKSRKLFNDFLDKLIKYLYLGENGRTGMSATGIRDYLLKHTIAFTNKIPSESAIRRRLKKLGVQMRTSKDYSYD